MISVLSHNQPDRGNGIVFRKLYPRAIPLLLFFLAHLQLLLSAVIAILSKYLPGAVKSYKRVLALLWGGRVEVKRQASPPYK